MAIITDLLPPTDGIKHQESNTCAVVQRNELGKGTLYIAESRVVWVGEGGRGLSLEYPNISVHAVSRDLSRFPQECLFLMICKPEDEENVRGNSSSSEEDEDDDATTEIRFIPDNVSTLDTMFKALSECQALHSVEEDDASSYNGEEEGSDEDDGEEIGAGDPGYEEAYSNGQDEEPMDVGRIDDGPNTNGSG